MKNFKEQLSNIKAFAFDCDGVFTDGKILPIPGGEMLRSYNAKDGFAVALAIKRGYKIALITGGKGEMVKERFSMLGVNDIYMSCHDKLEALKDFISKHNIDPQEILFMGDDTPDIDPMLYSAVAAAPQDAVNDVKSIATYISDKKGGDGCVRDVIEQVLKAQHQWPVAGSEKDILSR